VARRIGRRLGCGILGRTDDGTNRDATPRRPNFAANVFNPVGVFARLPCSRTSPRSVRQRQSYSILGHIQANIRNTLLRNPSPMREPRHRPSGATLENLHIVKRVALISGEHLV
jgi:hypothetical protein